MDQYTFKLKRPILIPAKNIRNAYTVFPSSTCALSYEVVPNPRQATMTVTLTIVDALSGAMIYKLDTFNITEQGFPTGNVLNAADIATWDTAVLPLKSAAEQASVELTNLQIQVAELVNTNQIVPQELTDAVDAKIAEIQTIDDAIVAAGPRPVPVLEYYNKYSDIIKYFDNTGAITAEGIIWAKNIPFLGLTIGDYIV